MDVIDAWSNVVCGCVVRDDDDDANNNFFLDNKLDVFGAVNDKHDLSCVVVASTSSSRREEERVLVNFMVLSSTMSTSSMCYCAWKNGEGFNNLISGPGGCTLILGANFANKIIRHIFSWGVS